MPAYIRTQNIFDGKVNIHPDENNNIIDIFFQKADASSDVCHVSAPLCLEISKYPDTSSSSRNVMMTNCPSLLSAQSTRHCVTRPILASIKYPIETVGKAYIENTPTLKIVPIVIVILKHLIMALMKVFRVRE